MKGEVKIFENEKFGDVRIAMSENGEPLFCLADICKSIGLSNPSSVKSRLDKDDLQLIDLHALKHNEGTIVGNSNANFVTESGLYDVLLYSDSPQVKPFRKWVTSEVLPSIRKTGGYVNDSSTFVDSYFSDLDDSAKQFLVQTLDSKKALLEENKKQQEQIAIMKPKEDFYDTVTGSPDTIDMRQVATTLNIKGVGRNKMFDILRTKGILDRRNIPYQNYVERGYFRTVESSYTKGDIVCINIKTVVYQKGVDFIKKVILRYLSNGNSNEGGTDYDNRDEI